MIKIKWFAKSTLVSLILVSGASQVSAQLDSAKNLPNLLLPEFTRSVVKFKSGEKKSAVLNYNLVDQELVFLQNGRYMVMDHPQLIDTVYMANRVFIPFQKAFYEVALIAPLSLFIQNKSNVEQEGSSIGYGQKSRSTGPTNLRQMYAYNGTYNLEIPPGYNVVEANIYWIRREDGTMQNFSNRRQFVKLFQKKQKELDQFISSNKIDFKRVPDVVKLVSYCNEINK
jgi:hypothetical protein